jgi:hypothetical protein
MDGSCSASLSAKGKEGECLEKRRALENRDNGAFYKAIRFLRKQSDRLNHVLRHARLSDFETELQ